MRVGDSLLFDFLEIPTEHKAPEQSAWTARQSANWRFATNLGRMTATWH